MTTPITKTRLKQVFDSNPGLGSVLVVEGETFTDKDDALKYCRDNPREHTHVIHEYFIDELDKLAETPDEANAFDSGELAGIRQEYLDVQQDDPDYPEPNEPELNGEPS